MHEVVPFPDFTCIFIFIYSVLLCYMGALTSVHGKSVALLKSQCKLVSTLYK